jgi:hypothetical protein
MSFVAKGVAREPLASSQLPLLSAAQIPDLSSQYVDRDLGNIGGLGLRNRFINGAMNVSQRGSSWTASGVFYTLDRWFVYPTGAAVPVSSIEATALTQLDTFPSYGQFRKWLQVLGAAGNTGVSIGQRIENIMIRDLAGKPVMISALVYSPNVRAIQASAITPNAVNGFAGAKTTRHQLSISLVTGWQLVKFPITALHAEAINGLEIVFDFGGLTDPGAAIGFTGAQLVEGSMATMFEHRLVPLEEWLCYRHFQRLVNPKMVGTQFSSTTIARMGMQLAVPMRKDPAVAHVGGSWSILIGNGSYTPGAISGTYHQPQSIEMDVALSTASTFPNGMCAISYGNPIFDLSAEL